MTEDEMGGWHHRLDGHEFEQTLGDSKGQGSLVCCSPGLPVHHQLREFTQTHVHRVGDAIHPSHPLSSPSPPAPNPFQLMLFPMSQLFT